MKKIIKLGSIFRFKKDNNFYMIIKIHRHEYALLEINSGLVISDNRDYVDANHDEFICNFINDLICVFDLENNNLWKQVH